MRQDLLVRRHLTVGGVLPPLVRVEVEVLQAVILLSLLAAGGKATLGRLNVLVRRPLRIFRR